MRWHPSGTARNASLPIPDGPSDVTVVTFVIANRGKQTNKFWQTRSKRGYGIVVGPGAPSDAIKAHFVATGGLENYISLLLLSILFYFSFDSSNTTAALT